MFSSLKIPNFVNLVDAVLWRAKYQNERVAFRYLADGDQETRAVTYFELDLQAKAIASNLCALTNPGDRVLLCFSSGTEFISAFIGCLYAKVIAVPAYPPKNTSTIRNLLVIAKDADPKVVLSTSDIIHRLSLNRKSFEEINCLPWISTDKMTLNQNWEPKKLKDDDIAFLQYTSGSTGNPKGVMITHGNLTSNTKMLGDVTFINEKSVCVSWLPLHHDMGLIGCVVLSLFRGTPTVFMPPAAFLERPLRWLTAISRYSGTHITAPNFAYDLCTRRVKASEMLNLNLSSLKVVCNGAEPIRAATMENFYKKFSEVGFSKKTFYPCYGLAEATLYVSGHHFDEGDEYDKVVNCGYPAEKQKIKIVNPQTKNLCNDNEEGEIWLSGPHIAKGYWNKTDVNESQFNAKIKADPTSYLRTGDLGFVSNKQIFVTGRIKDVIIIFGKNHYPQDLEYTMERAHSAVRVSGTCAFSYNRDGIEHLGLIAEVERTYKGNLQEVAHAILQCVSDEHKIKISSIMLVSVLSLPKTTSGKIQRGRCRQLFIDNSFKALFHWTPAASPIQIPKEISKRSGRVENLIEWLREYASRRLNTRGMDKRRTIPPHVVLDLGNMGLMGMLVPQTYGGLELSHKEVFEISQQLSAIDLSLAIFIGLNNSLGIHSIINSATNSMKERWLPELASGRQLSAFALSERGAGSNPIAIQSTAIPTAEGLRVCGEKVWIGNAMWAGVLSVFVKERMQDGSSKGISGFIIPQKHRGVILGPEHMTMGIRSWPQSSISFRDVLVTEEQRLGEAGKGMTVASETMNYVRFGLAMMSVGGMKRCLQQMMLYGERRIISTGLLCDNPVFLNSMEDLIFATSALEKLVVTLASTLDSGKSISEEWYLTCKILGPEWLWQGTDLLMQVLGARGYMESNSVPQFFRDARSLRIFEGPTESLEMHLGSIVTRSSEERLLENIFLNKKNGYWKSFCSDRKLFFEIQERELESSMSVRFLTNSILGKLTSLALVQNLAETSGDKALENWIAIKYEFIKQAGLSRLKMYPKDSKHLFSVIRSYEKDIGNVEIKYPGEENERDELLRLETHSPVFKENEMITPQVTSLQNDYKFNEIQNDLLSWLSANVRMAAQKIDPEMPLANFGFDSLMAFELAVYVEDKYNVRVPESIAWDYPTLNRLASYLFEHLSSNTRKAS